MTATTIQIRQFTDMVTRWTVDQLINYYARSYTTNHYGENDEELTIVRAEIHRRTDNSSDHS